MIRRTALPAILILAAVILGAFVANAIGGRYALHALEGMAADVRTTGQEIQTTVEEIFQGYGIEILDRGSHRTSGGHYRRINLTDGQRTAIREKVAEMREAGAAREEIRTAVTEMLRKYGIEVTGKRFRRIEGREQLG